MRIEKFNFRWSLWRVSGHNLVSTCIRLCRCTFISVIWVDCPAKQKSFFVVQVWVLNRAVESKTRFYSILTRQGKISIYFLKVSEYCTNFSIVQSYWPKTPLYLVLVLLVNHILRVFTNDSDSIVSLRVLWDYWSIHIVFKYNPRARICEMYASLFRAKAQCLDWKVSAKRTDAGRVFVLVCISNCQILSSFLLCARHFQLLHAVRDLSI